MVIYLLFGIVWQGSCLQGVYSHVGKLRHIHSETFFKKSFVTSELYGQDAMRIQRMKELRLYHMVMFSIKVLLTPKE